MRSAPLFVLGMWRSGTSLLYALLNQHPQIGLMYEGELAVLRSLFWIPGGKSDWAQRWNFWNSALDRHQIALDQAPKDVRRLPDAIRSIYRQHAAGKGATVWGCKSPNYYDFLPWLAEMFPAAQFIVIWRDPADVCRSILRAAEKDTWFRKRGVPHRALFGLRRMKLDCDRLQQQGIAIHEIEYEELVQNPSAVMKAICAFIDVPFDARMTSLEGADRSAIYDGEHHSGVKGGKIARKENRPEVLPPAFKAKIERYTRLWRRDSHGSWPPGPRMEEGNTPGWFETTTDQLGFRAMRAFDALTAFIYCFVPIRLLENYRRAKTRNFEQQQKQDVRLL